MILGRVKGTDRLESFFVNNDSLRSVMGYNTYDSAVLIQEGGVCMIAGGTVLNMISEVGVDNSV